MNSLQQTAAWFCVGGVLLGAGVGYSVGHRAGEQAGLDLDVTARETLVSELETLTALHQQQQVSLQTAEASIKALTDNMDDQQRAHEYDVRELQLYRRIESGGKERGIHVDDVQLVSLEQGDSLRVTLLQVGARDEVQGRVGVALIGADLPGSVDSRLVLADPEAETGLEFDFRFMTRLSVALPADLALPESSQEPAAWMEGLDLVEIDLIPADSRRRPKRVTVPADRMIVGPAE